MSLTPFDTRTGWAARVPPRTDPYPQAGVDWDIDPTSTVHQRTLASPPRVALSRALGARKTTNVFMAPAILFSVKLLRRNYGFVTVFFWSVTAV